VELFHRSRKNLKDGGSRNRILSGKNAKERLALLPGGARIDHSRSLAFPFMDRSRPFKNAHEPQVIQPGIAVYSFINLERPNGLTMAVSRQRVKLARAGVVAVAVDELFPFYAPFGISHGRLQKIVKMI
jgi:hypothetical protein